MPGTRKLGKTTDQRMAMLRQQVTDLLDNGRMETTTTDQSREATSPTSPRNGNQYIITRQIVPA